MSWGQIKQAVNSDPLKSLDILIREICFNDRFEKYFGNGSDGDFNSDGDVELELPESPGPYFYNFRNFTLNEGHTLTVKEKNNGLILKCAGICTIAGTIDQSGKAHAQTLNVNGTPWVNYACITLNANPLPIDLRTDFVISGGARSGVGGKGGASRFTTSNGITSGEDGKAGGASVQYAFGGGNGGNGGNGGVRYPNYDTGYGGGGGSGGGMIVILAPEIVIAETGAFVSAGADGMDGVNGGSNNGGGGGGGGGGGSVFLGYSHRYVNEGAAVLTGGIGGAKGAPGDNAREGIAGSNGADGTLTVKKIYLGSLI